MLRILDAGGRRSVFVWYFDHGLTVKAITLKLNGRAAGGAELPGKPMISRRTVSRLIRQFRKTGDWALGHRARRSDALSPEVLGALQQVVDEDPSRYLDEMQKRLENHHGIRLSVSQICRSIHPSKPRGLGYSRLVLERSAIQKDAIDRSRFRLVVDKLDPSLFVFFDEVHKGRNESARRRCYVERGRPYVRSERFDPKTFSMVVAFNHAGFIADTAFITKDTMDADSHWLWVDCSLAPQLGDYRNSEPNSVVIFDNVAFHWDARCLDRIRGTGALLVPLPAYSPEASTCSVPLISSPCPSSRFPSSPASPFPSSSLPSPCTIDQLTLALSRTVESHRASLPG